MNAKQIAQQAATLTGATGVSISVVIAVVGLAVAIGTWTVDRLDSRFVRMEDKLDSVESKVDAVGARLDTLFAPKVAKHVKD